MEGKIDFPNGLKQFLRRPSTFLKKGSPVRTSENFCFEDTNGIVRNDSTFWTPTYSAIAYWVGYRKANWDPQHGGDGGISNGY